MNKLSVVYIYVYTHTNTYTRMHTQWSTNSAFKRKEILTLATIWMNLEDLMLSETSQS